MRTTQHEIISIFNYLKFFFFKIIKIDKSVSKKFYLLRIDYG